MLFFHLDHKLSLNSQVSGALFSIGGAHGWMQWLMRANPLTYATVALYRLLGSPIDGATPGLATCLIVVIASSFVLWMAATWFARKKSKRSNA